MGHTQSELHVLLHEYKLGIFVNEPYIMSCTSPQYTVDLVLCIISDNQIVCLCDVQAMLIDIYVKYALIQSYILDCRYVVAIYHETL